ncbi:hypothetical protein [Parachitinimonas caeni]|uniref:Uncharacterized protein n=1 Tax=Parachitinimonas caeni TaxID=3031301 RepID=A0ABT7DXM7_9NEIS|nr:hypothetical protein [Parachitinimonas caeni]MDK2123833.1 hypothetical protein [Parachitinimonas caeni]
MSRAYHVHLSIYPLGTAEVPKALAAIRTAWIAPAWVRQREIAGAHFLEAMAEAPFRAGETETLFVERLSIAIWKRLGRYVKVVVEAGHENTPEFRHLELEEPDYLKLMRLH